MIQAGIRTERKRKTSQRLTQTTGLSMRNLNMEEANFRERIQTTIAASPFLMTLQKRKLKCSLKAQHFKQW